MERVVTQNLQHKAIPVTRLLDLLHYDNTSGKISVKKSDRVISADDTGAVTIYDPSFKVKRKMKLDVLAWVLLNAKELPDTHKILHKNLDQGDNSAKNLIAINRKEYSRVSEAIRNLDGEMKVGLHPIDQYKYVLSYRLNGVDRKETFDDIGTARNAESRMKVYFAKLVNNYAITV